MRSNDSPKLYMRRRENSGTSFNAPAQIRSYLANTFHIVSNTGLIYGGRWAVRAPGNRFPISKPRLIRIVGFDPLSDASEDIKPDWHY